MVVCTLCGPVMDWQPVQGVPCLSPDDHWDRLQPPRNPTNGLSGYRKWMDDSPHMTVKNKIAPSGKGKTDLTAVNTYAHGKTVNPKLKVLLLHTKNLILLFVNYSESNSSNKSCFLLQKLNCSFLLKHLSDSCATHSIQH